MRGVPRSSKRGIAMHRYNANTDNMEADLAGLAAADVPDSAAADVVDRIIRIVSRPPPPPPVLPTTWSARCHLPRLSPPAPPGPEVCGSSKRLRQRELASLQDCSGPQPTQASRPTDIPGHFEPAKKNRSGAPRTVRTKVAKSVQKIPSTAQDVVRGEGWTSSAAAGVTSDVQPVLSSKARRRVGRKEGLKQVDALSQSRINKSKRHLKGCKRQEVRAQHPGIFSERFDGCKTALVCNICKFVVRDGAAATPARITRHLSGKTHLSALARHTKQASIQGDVCKMLNVERSSKDGVHAVFQAATVKMCVSLAIPLEKVNGMRDYLEFYTSHKLQDASNLRKLYIPMIRQAHFAEVADAVAKGALLSLVHDGTSRFATYYCIVVRWVTGDLEIQQRCLNLQSYTGHLKGGQLAMAIDGSLQSVGARKGAFLPDGGLDLGSLLSINRDRASVNQAAANAIAPLYLGYFDLECCSHSLVKPGEYVAFPALTEFKDRLMIALNSSAFAAHVLSYVTKPLRKPLKLPHSKCRCSQSSFPHFLPGVSIMILNCAAKQFGNFGRSNATKAGYPISAVLSSLP
jgi:hypothetical protein